MSDEKWPLSEAEYVAAPSDVQMVARLNALSQVLVGQKLQVLKSFDELEYTSEEVTLSLSREGLERLHAAVEKKERLRATSEKQSAAPKKSKQTDDEKIEIPPFLRRQVK